MKIQPRSGLLIALLCLIPLCASAQIARKANSTLTLPLEPVSANGAIVLTELFPGVTFESPVCVRSAPGDTNQLFVVERYGRIMVITNLADPKPQVFLDIQDRVFASDWITNRRTEGLSSIAFHPHFKENGRFFVSYCIRTVDDEGVEKYYNRLAEFSASDDRTVGLPDSETPYITQFDEGDGHNINDLHFGPDDYLYVAIGDEGDGNTGGDEYNNAQKIDRDFFSAIMRIDVDKRPGNLLPNPHPAGTTNYWVPADNPFVRATNFLGKAVDPQKVHTEFWAVGLRNPWRISFDPLTEAMYEGDVGQHTREEINRIVRGGNYGWSFKEGTAKGPKAPAPAGFTFIDPLVEYGPGYGQSEGFSITCGVVYRGFRIPSLYGSLLFADYVSGNIWAVNIDQKPVSKPVWLLNQKGIASFGYDPRNGDILAVYHSEKEPGKIYRVDVSGVPTESYPATLADTGIFSDLKTLTPNEGIVPYDVNLSFWSDGAIKSRWFSIPDPAKMITFSGEDNWLFPEGTVWVKHFDLESTPGDPTTSRRVETRVLVKCTVGIGIYGLSYQWTDDGVNATLVPETGDTKSFVIADSSGTRTQSWRFPARAECLACHTTFGGLALGFNTAQLNKAHQYGQFSTNQLGALAASGYFRNPPQNLSGLRALAPSEDETISRTYRVRSYLAANCSFCHQPGGSALSGWDARTATPISFANIIDGALHNALGDLSNRVVVAGSPDHSAIFRRISSTTERMPPVGSSVLDQKAIELLSAWINEDLPKYEIYDGWAKRIFGEPPSVDSSAEADPDGDGLTNYEEFLAGTNPLSASSKFEVRPQIVHDQVKFSVTPPPGRALLLEETTSLSEPYWELSDVPENFVTFPIKPSTRTKTDYLSLPQKYYRVRLLEP